MSDQGNYTPRAYQTLFEVLKDPMFKIGMHEAFRGRSFDIDRIPETGHFNYERGRIFGTVLLAEKREQPPVMPRLGDEIRQEFLPAYFLLSRLCSEGVIF